MTRFLLAAALPAALLLAGRPAPLAAQTGLTVYNDGRVLVRRTVPLQLPKGVSEQRLTLGALDPSTLFALDSGVTFVGARYDGGVDEGSILRRAVGRKVTFQLSQPRDTVSALVLGVDPERYRMPDGSIVFTRPGILKYPAELVLADPTVALTVRSDSARRSLGVGYFTGGAAWQASYDVLLGKGAARVTGTAVVPSQTLRADSAEIQLLAGAVSRVAPQAPPQPYAMRDMAAMKAVNAQEGAVASEQKVGEFHLYSLPGRWSILPGVTTSIAMFEPASVAYERSFVVRGEIPFWGYFPQQPNENPVPVEVSYLLKRPRKSDFGDRPIPMGVARLYAADSSGRQQLVGEAAVQHTAAGQDLRLSAGDAFDLTARRVQTNYTVHRDSTRSGWRTTATADYAVTIANAADSAATVDVLEQRAGDWSVVSSSVPPEKVSSTETRFRVKVPARGETRLTYRVRVTW